MCDLEIYKFVFKRYKDSKTILYCLLLRAERGAGGCARGAGRGAGRVVAREARGAAVTNASSSTRCVSSFFLSMLDLVSLHLGLLHTMFP